MKKGLLLVWSVGMMVCVSCTKNALLNNRVPIPNFKDSGAICASFYISHGLHQVGGDVGLKPLKFLYFTGGGNKGALGQVWNLGGGLIPYQNEKVKLCFMAQYNKGEVGYSYSSPIDFFSYNYHGYSIQSKYFTWSATPYLECRSDSICYVKVGVRTNKVSFEKYKENIVFVRDSPKNTVYTYQEVKSFELSSVQSLYTIDPFVDVTFYWGKHIYASFQALYSLHGKYKKIYNVTHEGFGYLDDKYSWTESRKWPHYRPLVINVAFGFLI